MSGDIQIFQTFPAGGSSALSAVTVSYVGTPVGYVEFVVIQPKGYQVNSDLYTTSGKWVESLVGGFPAGITELYFPDLAGIAGGLTISATEIEKFGSSVQLIFGGIDISSNTLLEEITDLSSLSFCGAGVSITNNTAMTVGPTFENLEFVVDDFYFVGNTSLVTAPTLELLTRCVNLTISNNTAMVDSPVLGNLTQCDEFIISGNSSMVDSPQMASLTVVNGPFVFTSNASVTDGPAAPIMVSCGDFDCGENTSMVTPPDVSSLEFTDGYFTIFGCAITAPPDLSNYIRCLGDFTFQDNAACTTFSWDSSLEEIDGDCFFSGNALDQTSVDGILVSLAALDGSGSTTSYDDHTIDISGGTNATPGATGLTAKATLEGRGCTVTVN